MYIGYSILARKPNYLYFRYWLYDEIDGEIVLQIDPAKKGALELNDAEITPKDLTVGGEGYYELTLKVHDQIFDTLSNSLGKIKFIIGSLSTVVTDPTIVYLNNTDKRLDDSEMIELSSQLGLRTEYPNWPISGE